MQRTQPHRYETLAEAAERHRCSVKTLRRRISDGRLTAYRFGPTLIRLNPAEVDALLRPIPSAAAGAPETEKDTPGRAPRLRTTC